MGRLQDKIAIVTGAGSGIGEAAARRFAREGAKVVVAELNAEAGERVAAEIRAGGGTALAIRTDVADPASVEAMVAATMREWGRVDVLYNNAGGPSRADGPIESVAIDVIRRTLDVDLMGVVHCSRFAIPRMIEAGGGSVINTSSVLGIQGTPNRIAYSVAKGAVAAMSRGMAAQYARHKVRVNAIAPGMVAVPRVQQVLKENETVRRNMRRYVLGPIPPEEVAALALFLASDESAHLSGAVIPIDSAGQSAPAAWLSADGA